MTQLGGVLEVSNRRCPSGEFDVAYLPCTGILFVPAEIKVLVLLILAHLEQKCLLRLPSLAHISSVFITHLTSFAERFVLGKLHTKTAHGLNCLRYFEICLAMMAVTGPGMPKSQIHAAISYNIYIYT